jgi:DNA-binding MarR family transcriptional regulator
MVEVERDVTHGGEVRLATVAASPRPAPSGPPTGDVAAFEDAFIAFVRALRVARARAAHDPSFAGLSLAQYQLLDAVDTAGHEGNARIAAVAGVTQPTVTRALSTLERRGLIMRVRGDDRRSIRVALTDVGQRELAHKRDLVRRRLGELHRSLDEVEQVQAVALMGRLAELIETL